MYRTSADVDACLRLDFWWMCARIQAQCVNFDFGLQRGLQQDPSHGRPGAEEHRGESDVPVQGRANEECRDKETKKPRVHLSCSRAQRIVQQYLIKTSGKYGPRHSMPFLNEFAMCPKCTRSAVMEWVQIEDGQAYTSAKEKRLTKAKVVLTMIIKCVSGCLYSFTMGCV